MCSSDLLAGDVDDRAYLLVFEPDRTRPDPHAASDMPALDVTAENLERMELLEHELSATREHLQSAIEELETANEELQATNEELMASNEELQSTNEELQSVNEELHTINAEFREKIEILDRVNADLDSLSKVASGGAIFLDEALQVTRFNPDASLLFRLRGSDIGRPLSDLVHSMDFPDLLEQLGACLIDERLREREVGGADGRRYYVKLLPYRTPSTAARGVVLSFIDTTLVHQASRLQQIMDALAEHIAVLDRHGRIVQVNAAWRAFAADNGDPEMRHCGPGTDYLAVCQPQSGPTDADGALQAAAGVRAVLAGEQPAFTLEYPCHSPQEARWFVMHVRPLDGSEGGAVVSHVNITAWHHRGESTQRPGTAP